MNAKKKKAVRTLVKSGLALLLSVFLFASFTYAWFTVSATSRNNEIKAGTLMLDVKGWDADYDSTKDWYRRNDDYKQDLNSNPILDGLINEVDWSPNQYGVKYISLQNTGSLDLKFTIVLQI